MGLVSHRDQVVGALADDFAVASDATARIACIQSTVKVGIGAVLHIEDALKVNTRSVGAQALDLARPPSAVEEDDGVAQFIDDQIDAAFVQPGAIGQVTG
jgi:hypothetical protein